eukprot:jgi/Chlat1/4782/Chrsp308S04748
MQGVAGLGRRLRLLRRAAAASHAALGGGAGGGGSVIVLPHRQCDEDKGIAASFSSASGKSCLGPSASLATTPTRLVAVSSTIRASPLIAARFTHTASEALIDSMATTTQPTATSTETTTAIHEPPPGTPVVASPDEMPHVLPFTHELSELRVSYIPPLDWSSAGVPLKGEDALKIKEPRHSWIEVVYPFSSSAFLVDQYRLFGTKYIRFGKILEDMDALAGDVAVRHTEATGVALVTAAVDHIDWSRHVSLDRDLSLQGQVTWVGNSSLEVRLRASYIGKDSADLSKCEYFIGEALFVFVARDPKMESAVKVHRLQPTTPHEIAAFKERDNSLLRVPPTPEELAMIHALFMEAKRWEKSFSTGAKSQQMSNATSARSKQLDLPAGPPWVSMKDTVHNSVHLMHSQDRNVHERVFGGHLMRIAYELAWATAFSQIGVAPRILAVDDIAFIHPVSIGSILEFRSQVIYSAEGVLRVMVTATDLTPGLGKRQVTNNFSFAFSCPDPDAMIVSNGGMCTVRRVMPDTYEEAILYVHGYRQHVQNVISGKL